MSLESEVESVLSHSSVERVEVEDNTSRVQVMYESHEFFREWPHGASEGTHKEQEDYFQEQFGVDWSLVEIETGSTRGGMDSQVAIFDR